MNLPVFDRNQGLIGRALFEQRGHELMASALDARVHEEVSGAWRARAEARRALDEFRNGGLAATTELLRRAEASYREGAFTVMDLLDAYRSVWEARSQELDLERDFADAEAELERAAALIMFR
jgi:cobalt-zinc-cadmium efflux system outer membrane protein